MSLNKMTVEAIVEYVDPNDSSKIIKTRKVFVNQCSLVERIILKKILAGGKISKELAKKEAELLAYNKMQEAKNIGAREDTKNKDAQVKQNNAGPPEN